MDGQTSGETAQLRKALGDATARHQDQAGDRSGRDANAQSRSPSDEPESTYGLLNGLQDACGIATRLMGWNSASASSPGPGLESQPSTDEILEEQGPDARISMDESWQALQKMLTNLQDQSWLIAEDQLSVCIQTAADGSESDVRLGRGSFGSVYKAIMNKSEAVAIKAIKNPTMRAKMEFVNEMAMLMNLRHQNIVQCFGAVIDRRNLLLVMEFMPRGDLFTTLQRDRTGTLRWHGRGQSIMLDVTRGVVHMHDHNIIHQDIKSGNVMLTKGFTAKIGDVGLAAVLERDRTRTSSCGTLEWAAPEVLLGSPASPKTDVFSLGVVLWEILTGERPKRGSLRPIKAPDECPKEIAKMVDRCIDTDPNLRPATHELFECLTSTAMPAGRALSEESL